MLKILLLLCNRISILYVWFRTWLFAKIAATLLNCMNVCRRSWVHGWTELLPVHVDSC